MKLQAMALGAVILLSSTVSFADYALSYDLSNLFGVRN